MSAKAVRLYSDQISGKMSIQLILSSIVFKKITGGAIYKGSGASTAKKDVTSGPPSPKKRTKLISSFKIPAFKRTKGMYLHVSAVLVRILVFPKLCINSSAIVHHFQIF